MIPKDVMEQVWLKLPVKEYIMRTLIEGGRHTHVDGQTVLCGERLPSSRPSKQFASYGNYVNPLMMDRHKCVPPSYVDPLDDGSTQVCFAQLCG